MNAAPDFAGVAALLRDYFDGLYHCDVERLSRVFHPQARYGCIADGGLLQLDMPQYFSILRQRMPPASQGHVRTDRIRSIEFAGPATAHASVECSIPGKDFVDFLALVHLDGRWQILGKVFHHEVRQQPAAEPVSP